MRPIPAILFRVVGVAILLAALALPGWWAATDAGPYRWLVGVLPFTEGLLAFLLVLLGCLLLSLVPILGLRQLTAGMPTLADEAATLQQMKQGDFSEAEALMRSSSFVRGMGIAMVMAGVGMLALGYVLLVDTGWLYTSLMVAGAVFAVLGLVAAISGRMPKQRGNDRRPRREPYRQTPG